DVPNGEALGGAEGPSSPVYDPQQVNNDSTFSFIEKGKALIDPDGGQIDGNQDLVFKGDMDQWMAFANTLELKAYLRLSEVDPDRAKAGVQQLYTDNAQFLTTDAAVQYTMTGGNQ